MSSSFLQPTPMPSDASQIPPPPDVPTARDMGGGYQPYTWDPTAQKWICGICPKGRQLDTDHIVSPMHLERLAAYGYFTTAERVYEEREEQLDQWRQGPHQLMLGFPGPQLGAPLDNGPPPPPPRPPAAVRHAPPVASPKPAPPPPPPATIQALQDEVHELHRTVDLLRQQVAQAVEAAQAAVAASAAHSAQTVQAAQAVEAAQATQAAQAAQAAKAAQAVQAVPAASSSSSRTPLQHGHEQTWARAQMPLQTATQPDTSGSDYSDEYDNYYDGWSWSKEWGCWVSKQP